jgi:hypothetical protein
MAQQQQPQHGNVHSHRPEQQHQQQQHHRCLWR